MHSNEKAVIGPYGDRDWTHLEKLYAACTTVLDTDVGRIIRQLQELGIDEDTLILFSSDNGDENSYYQFTNRFEATGPLKGKKRYLYEGGIRVPTIARWPGTIKPDTTTDLIAAGWDFMATFAELAGVEPPAHHSGISIVPTLLGQPEKQTPREYLYWEYHQGKQQAVRMGPWKGIRIGGTKEPIELYNLADDIGEHNDTADEHPEIVKRISEIMIEAREGSEFNDFWPLPERRRRQLRRRETGWGAARGGPAVPNESELGFGLQQRRAFERLAKPTA